MAAKKFFFFPMNRTHAAEDEARMVLMILMILMMILTMILTTILTTMITSMQSQSAR